jgi:3-oxoacyl-[acyl-carrier protein] reductase
LNNPKNQSDTIRTALVTGASRGLEQQSPRHWPRAEPESLSITCRTGRQPNKFVTRFTGWGASLNHFRQTFEMTMRLDEVDRLVDDVIRRLGPVDILVPDTTGPQPFLSIEQQTWADYLDQLEFFVKSPLLLLKKVLPSMRHRKFGRIIQIGSEVVELGNPRFANYVAAKAAQLGLTRSWALELAESGITVNLVAPGWIPTERHRDATSAEVEAYTANVLMKRMGTPTDVASVVAFLASPAASFITGQKFSVNGANTLS